MKHIICAAYDNVSQIYGNPFMVRATGQAIRDFTTGINQADDNNQLYKHPDDFDLYALATFDDETGLYESHGTPTRIMRGKDAKNTTE